MPTSDLVRYSGPKSRELQVKSDSSSFGSGGEDWITKKRVETKTVKTQEKRIQRQVVLEDGRVIEEDDPEITVDTVEDTENFSDDADDDIKNIGGSLVPASTVISPWAPGYNVVGEKLKRNTTTNQVSERSITTACASNLGDVKVKDIDGIINRGKKVKSVVSTRDYEGGDPGKIAAKITHKDANRKKNVDIEDIREINSMNASGQSRTDRIVSREFIDDNQEETPSDGESESEETESRDGDRDAFSQRKEEKTIDYYKLPKGKTMKDAKFVRRGLHMTSSDKNDQQGGALNFTSGRPALRYDSDSTTNSLQLQKQHVRKPPRHDRPHSRGTRGPSRYTSSERDEPRKFHTIERTSSGPWVRSKEDPYRSRSISRSPNYTDAKRDLRTSKELNKSTGNILRADLDTERAGRLRRAMSFKDTSRGAASEISASNSNSAGGPKASFLDSVKSLYATISKAALSKVPQRPKTPTFSTDNGSSPPKRPPRKPRSQSSMSDINNHHKSMSSLNTMSKAQSRTTLDGRTWDVHSGVPATNSSTLPRSSRLATPTRPIPQPRPSTQNAPSHAPTRGSKTRLSIVSGTASNRSSSMERSSNPNPNNSGSHMVHGFRNQTENRDAPKFEKRERDTTSRFFGQGPVVSDGDDGEVVERSRPPPDMRRHLLDSVNRSRSNATPKQPSVIRAM